MFVMMEKFSEQNGSEFCISPRRYSHMKKFIQFISFVFIAVVFSVVAVSAQSSQKFKAEIPFDFAVGKNTYSAGTYNVRVVKSSTVAVLTLSDQTGKELERISVSPTGTVPEAQSLFTFIRSGDKRFLSKITCAEASYDVPVSHSKMREAVAGPAPAVKAAVPISSM